MSGRSALIVLAHQEKTSFNYAMKDAAVEALTNMGWKFGLWVRILAAGCPRVAATTRFLSAIMGGVEFAGDPKDPKAFKYGVETMAAFKEGRLAKDIVEEQKKVEAADLVIFQFPLYWFGLPALLKGWVERVFSIGFAYSLQTLYSNGPFKNKKAVLSFTTGAGESMFTDKGLNGDINVNLWPIQNGVLNFCGFKVLEPQISYGVAHIPHEARTAVLEGWKKRLETIWDEKPIKFLPVQDFDLGGGFVLKKEVVEANSDSKTGLTVGQHLGKALPPDSQVKSEGTRL